MRFQQKAIHDIAHMLGGNFKDKSDHELLDIYCSKKLEEAFSELVKRHINMVYTRCLRTLHNPDLAQDITQAVFIMFEKKSEEISKKKNVSGWLYKAAKFASIDALRVEMRKKNMEGELQERYAMIDDENRKKGSYSEYWPHIYEALDHLKERYRDVIVLKYLEGKSNQEIGQILGLSLKVVENCSARAIKKLQQWMSKKGISLSGLLLTQILLKEGVEAAPKTIVSSISTFSYQGAEVEVCNQFSFLIAKRGLKMMILKKSIYLSVGMISTSLIGATLWAYSGQGISRENNQVRQDQILVQKSSGIKPKKNFEEKLEHYREKVQEIFDEVLEVPDELLQKYPDYVNKKNIGIHRMLNRGAIGFEIKPMRGAAAYFSFSELSHKYSRHSQIGLENWRFKSGFAGGNFGTVLASNLDIAEVSINDLDPYFSIDFNSVYSEYRGNRRKWSKRPKAIVGSTYIIRAITEDEFDIVVALKVVEKDKYGLTMIWKILKKHPVPTNENFQQARELFR